MEMDLTEFIVHDEDEVRQKEQIWDTMNADYLQKQELKRLQLEEAHQVSFISYPLPMHAHMHEVRAVYLSEHDVTHQHCACAPST